MKSKTIELECACCHNKFSKDLKEYKSRTRLYGQTEFYCSASCRNTHRIDEYSPFRTFLVLCRKNVRLKKFDFDLDLPYLKTLWEKQKGICPYSKVPMLLFPTLHKTKFKPTAASLDRIDSNRGYVKGNVEFVCLSINYAKNRFDRNEFIEFISNINQFTPEDRIAGPTPR
jgi:hypothetical protein